MREPLLRRRAMIGLEQASLAPFFARTERSGAGTQPIVRLEGLPGAWHGVRIAHRTDLHCRDGIARANAAAGRRDFLQDCRPVRSIIGVTHCPA